MTVANINCRAYVFFPLYVTCVCGCTCFRVPSLNRGGDVDNLEAVDGVVCKPCTCVSNGPSGGQIMLIVIMLALWPFGRYCNIRYAG